MSKDDRPRGGFPFWLLIGKRWRRFDAPPSPEDRAAATGYSQHAPDKDEDDDEEQPRLPPPKQRRKRPKPKPPKKEPN